MAGIQRLLDASVTHEQVADRVALPLTIGAWVGLGLVAIEALVVHLGHAAMARSQTWPALRWAVDGLGHPRLVVAVMALVVIGGLVLAATTNGFRQASARGQVGLLGLLGAGAVAAIPLTFMLAVGALVVGLCLAVAAFVLWVIVVVLDDALS